MSGFQKLLAGAVGGALGAAAGHLSVMLAYRWSAGESGMWLKGPHGPPFFDLTLSTAVFYAFLGASLYEGRGRLRGALVGGSAVFLSLALPMSVATRSFAWGEGAAEPETLRWFYLILATCVLANLGSAALLGTFWRFPASRRRTLHGAASVPAAAILQSALNYVLPWLSERVIALGYLAPRSAVFSGALWGLVIAWALSREGGAPDRAFRPTSSP